MSKQPRIVAPVSRGQKRGFSTEQLDTLRASLSSNLLELAVLNTAVDSMLRSSDLLSLTVAQVMEGSTARPTFATGQRKDGNRTVTCLLTAKTQASLAAYVQAAGLSHDAKLFPFCAKTLQRMVKAWASSLSLDAKEYSCHSLRRTKAKVLYERTKDIANIQTLLGHKWITSTQSYLGQNVDTAMHLASLHDV